VYHFFVQDHLQVALEHIRELLVQTQSQVSLKTFEFIQIIILVGTSFIGLEVLTELSTANFFRFFRFTYSPPLGITKVLLIGIGP